MGRYGHATVFQQENEGTVGRARTIKQRGEAVPWSKDGEAAGSPVPYRNKGDE